jgi:hypothetical protein
MWRLILSLLLLVVACGPGQAQATASPSAGVATPSALSPSPTPSTSGPLLFAVLEAKIPGSPYEWNTVAIAGLDGRARAKTTFVPMPVPDVGCMGANIPQSAQVADGKVYFADGTGVVRSLAPNGQIARIASFPFSGHQQMLSFAVSPDGSQLLGAVFTLPAKPNLGCNGSPSPGGFSLDVYSAKAGGSSTLLYHEGLPNPPPNVMALAGWDAVGPVGTYPTVWASQGGGPGSGLGVKVRIDASTGKVLRQVADPNSCLVWDIAASGDFVCIPPGVSARVSVRRPDGSEIWHFTATTPVNGLWNPFLAPDEQHVVVDGTNYSTEEVAGKSGSRVTLGNASFGVNGWLDSTTLIGNGVGPNVGPGSDMAYVGLSAPDTVVSLGFQGMFVGTLNT